MSLHYGPCDSKGLTEFGKLLREHRIRTGIHLGDLAKGIGVGSAHLSALETGKIVPDDTIINKMCYFMVLGLHDQERLLEAKRCHGGDK